MAPDRLLTLEEVSDRLRTPVNTLRYWRQNGRGPKGTRIGRRVLYQARDVDSWIEEQMAADRQAS